MEASFLGPELRVVGEGHPPLPRLHSIRWPLQIVKEEGCTSLPTLQPFTFRRLSVPSRGSRCTSFYPQFLILPAARLH